MNNFYLITTWFFLIIIYILFYFKVTKRACKAVIIFISLWISKLQWILQNIMTLILCKKNDIEERDVSFDISLVFLWFRKIISQMFLFFVKIFFGNYNFIFFTRIMIENFLMHKVSLFGVFKIVSIKFYAVLSWLRGHFQIDLATPTFYTTHAPHEPSTEKKKEIRCSEIVTLLKWE